MTIVIRREEKRREENDNPPVTHQIHPKPPFKTLKLYVSDKDAELVRVLKEAMKRDSSSVSAWFLDRAREWYKGHAPGNPQTPLEKWGDEADLGLGERPQIQDFKAAVLDEMTVEDLLVTVQDPILSINEKRYIAWLIMEKRIRQGLQNKE